MFKESPRGELLNDIVQNFARRLSAPLRCPDCVGWRVMLVTVGKRGEVALLLLTSINHSLRNA